MSVFREATSRAMRQRWQDPEFRTVAVANMSRLTWTPDMLDALRSLRANNASYSQCGRVIGVHKNTVQRKCRELDL